MENKQLVFTLRVVYDISEEFEINIGEVMEKAREVAEANITDVNVVTKSTNKLRTYTR